jgi:hypothetical protein
LSVVGGVIPLQRYDNRVQVVQFIPTITAGTDKKLIKKHAKQQQKPKKYYYV